MPEGLMDWKQHKKRQFCLAKKKVLSENGQKKTSETVLGPGQFWEEGGKIGKNLTFEIDWNFD